MNINGKYKTFETLPLPQRSWPGSRITKAPIWCSVDLRDGNQALVNPMGIETKLKFFELLVKLGFKEIEVGFPAASDTEFNFIRRLIDEDRVPDDVYLQVLSQAREPLIKRTFEAVKGAKNVIFHIYNATSPSQRKYNFDMTKEQVLNLAVEGVGYVKKHMNIVTKVAARNVVLEYSPENFSQTETDFAVEVCNAVMKAWGATPENKVILNLPATVECCMPNQFADEIEYFCQHIGDAPDSPGRESCIISLHNHNDRGEGVAQCELGLLAGADRVEGCLFGNGERTGNLDIVNVALNMYTQGIDPGLDFSDVLHVATEYERFTGMKVHPRAPYAGELVFTAFSGSHQDSIRKAMHARESMPENAPWDVPYLLIDPHDIGRKYEGIIRINSQSGKGGAAFILENDFGIFVPKAMQPVVGAIIKEHADAAQRELQPEEIYKIFKETWVQKKSPLNVLEITERHIDGERGSDTPEQVAAMATIVWEGKQYVVAGNGNGPLDAFVLALRQTPVPHFNITSFHEHSIGSGSDTQAMAYVEITKDSGEKVWGVGKSSNVGRAGISAVVSAINFSEI